VKYEHISQWFCRHGHFRVPHILTAVRMRAHDPWRIWTLAKWIDKVVLGEHEIHSKREREGHDGLHITTPTEPAFYPCLIPYPGRIPWGDVRFRIQWSVTTANIIWRREWALKQWFNMLPPPPLQLPTLRLQHLCPTYEICFYLNTETDTCSEEGYCVEYF
jgi:hypothetical protein